MSSKKDYSVIIADDHPMLLKGLYEELTNNEYNVIGQAANGMQALELILTQKPTIALLDIDMPLLTGFEIIKMAKDKGTDTKFVVLSFHREGDYITQAKALQIDGYLLKEDPFFEIEACIEEVLKGKTYFSKSIDKSVLNLATEELKKLRLLTPSEITILKLIAQQISTNEIAKSLFVSVRTIEKHRSNIIAKLEIQKGTNSLTNWALTNKNVIHEF